VLRQGRLAGVVSRADLVRAIARGSLLAPVPPEGDAAIRSALLEALAGRRWAPRPDDVQVVDGVVHLWCHPLSPEEERALRLAVSKIASVKGLELHLPWPRTGPPGL
jgi:hypothetical protein